MKEAEQSLLPKGKPRIRNARKKGMVICKDFLFGSKLFSVICSREYCR